MPEIVPFEQWLRLRSADAPGRTYSDTPGAELLPLEDLRYPMMEGQTTNRGHLFNRPLNEGMQDEMLAKIARGKMRELYEAGINPLQAMQQQHSNLAAAAARPMGSMQPSSMMELIQRLKFLRGM